MVPTQRGAASGVCPDPVILVSGYRGSAGASGLAFILATRSGNSGGRRSLHLSARCLRRTRSFSLRLGGAPRGMGSGWHSVCPVALTSLSVPRLPHTPRTEAGGNRGDCVIDAGGILRESGRRRGCRPFLRLSNGSGHHRGLRPLCPPRGARCCSAGIYAPAPHPEFLWGRVDWRAVSGSSDAPLVPCGG